MRFSRILSVVAASVLALAAGGTAMARAVPLTAASVAVANDAHAAVGDTWQEVLRSGQRVTMQKVALGVSRSLTLLPMSTSQCPGQPYLCAWSGRTFDGTFWRYNMNNVYSNTANGVAHCWNMAADANNNTHSWYNMSDRGAILNNWVNCNASGERLTILKKSSPLDCFTASSVQDWCNTLHPTSITAGP